MNHVLSWLVFILPIPGSKVPTQRNPEGSGPKAPSKRAGPKPRPKVGWLPNQLNRTNSTPKGNRNRNQKDRTQRGRHHNTPRGNRTPSLPRQSQGGKRGRAHYATHPPCLMVSGVLSEFPATVIPIFPPVMLVVPVFPLVIVVVPVSVWVIIVEDMVGCDMEWILILRVFVTSSSFFFFF